MKPIKNKIDFYKPWPSFIMLPFLKYSVYRNQFVEFPILNRIIHSTKLGIAIKCREQAIQKYHHETP